MDLDHDLLETLRDAQRFGFFGDRPIEEAAAHSYTFVEAIGEVAAGTRIIDLGSGGGLPGLVLAAAYPTIELTLLDRRQKRTDFLARVVRRHRWAHVEVRCADADELVRAVATEQLAPFAVVTARGFGPPDATLRTASGLLADTGRVIISEPPGGDRWSGELLADLGFRSARQGAVRVFSR